MLVENQERRRFTVPEVLRMLETRVLGEDEPLELIEGELIVVPPQGVPVYWLVDLVARRVEERTQPDADGDYRITELYTARDELELPGLDERVSVAALLGLEI